jgi:hypothetical protein
LELKFSFNQVVEKIKEHYGICIPISAVQIIIKRLEKGCYEMIEQDACLSNKESK